MASPQCEDGYCKIANELLEAICGTKLCGEQFRVLFVIFRKTYGFNKKSDAIPISQIQKITKLPRQSVCRTLNALKNGNFITSHKNATRTPSTYSIQKDWEKWRPSHQDATSSHKNATSEHDKPASFNDLSPSRKTVTSHKNATSPSHRDATNLVTGMRPSKDNIQKTTRKTKPPLTPLGGNGVDLPSWMPEETWTAYRQHRITLKAKMTPYAERLALKKLEGWMGTGSDPVSIVNQSMERGWKGLFELPENNSLQASTKLSKQGHRNMAAVNAMLEKEGLHDRH